MTVEHLPVLLREVIALLSPREGGTYIDATVGLGGHSEEILKMIGQDGRVIGIDKDEEALRRTAARLRDNRLILRRGGFSGIEDIVGSAGINEADGILFDLGVSMMQFKDLRRGFSFSSEERLDMRMDISQKLSAWDVINRYPENDLIRILKDYGEEYKAARIVRAIAGQRKRKPIDTCVELADIVARAVGTRGRLHPATKTFQALRIEVNREIGELKEGLDASLRLLRKGGRLCVISYHSLEDRTVKNFMRDNAREQKLRLLVKKPIVPDIREVRGNPSSRSAKLRGAERL
ncbi:S-adenosyl-dependent methyltransferase activity on membrane-located substrates [Candidatus Sulfobium mesophilum]|uniref:Ribosomal RNA small subunit methyltransferase H n=1 Tax=Candidatus Sulfobium mesophilum TaxID=2016548 RepID=A0A2U3QJC1_9BACT|nr:S-adenosyl-dependent methyltransferase activity on membrane-located substrates [Candidatus Sulfobium mesophilum]